MGLVHVAFELSILVRLDSTDDDTGGVRITIGGKIKLYLGKLKMVSGRGGFFGVNSNLF